MKPTACRIIGTTRANGLTVASTSAAPTTMPDASAIPMPRYHRRVSARAAAESNTSSPT